MNTSSWAWPVPPQPMAIATNSLVRRREEEEESLECSSMFNTAPAAAMFQVVASTSKRQRHGLGGYARGPSTSGAATKSILILYRTDVFKETAQGLSDIMTRAQIPTRIMDYQNWYAKKKAAAWRGSQQGLPTGHLGGIAGPMDGMMVGKGWGAPQVRDEDESVGLYILFGANLMTQGDFIPRPYVVYQSEQLKSQWMSQEYLQLLKGATSVWDFSLNHVHYWRIHQQINAVYVPMYAPYATLFSTTLQLQSPSRHLPDPQPIDILFYGLRNQRREDFYKKMMELGAQYNLNVSFFMSYDLFGEQREAAIAQSKVVLNLHYYDSAALEVHRIVYLLCKAKCVVSETSSDPTLDNMYRNKVFFCTYEEMPWKAVELVMDQAKRRALELEGFNHMHREHTDCGHVREALAASSFSPAAPLAQSAC